jgi:Zn-dependent protease
MFNGWSEARQVGGGLCDQREEDVQYARLTKYSIDELPRFRGQPAGGGHAARGGVVGPYHLPVFSLRRHVVAGVFAGVFLVVDAVVCALLVTESVTRAFIVVGLACMSLWVHIVLHECGHLIMALLLRLPVVAVRIAPFTGWRSAVLVQPVPSATALPLRMVLLHLGGPMTNLVTAGVLGAAAAWTGTTSDTLLMRVALLAAAFVAALLAVVNLIPGLDPHSDASNVRRWLLAPTSARAALRAGYLLGEVSRKVPTIAGGEGDDDRLADPVDDQDEARRALAAFRRRSITGPAQPTADLVADAAQEEARMLKHDYIGTEHILLGLIHEGEGVAAKALESLGISLQGVRQQVDEIIGRGQQAPSRHIPFTPRAKKVLELSLRESQQLGHKYIGTEHILLGLIREGEGVAAQVLVKLGADLNRARQQVIQLLSAL